MALTNYTELQNAVASWLARPGDPTLTPHIPDFIALAEARLYRRLRVRQMEARTPLTLAGGYTSLPSDFLEARNLHLTGASRQPLAYAPVGELDVLGTTAPAGAPRLYAVVGDSLRVFPEPDGSYAAELGYFRRLPALSEANPANALLGVAPDIFLYGSLLEAAPFLMNDERIPVWLAGFESAVGTLQAAHDAAGSSGSPLQVRRA